MEIRETQIEDILISSPTLAKEILGLDEEPRLIGRQIIVPSGRLDMLYAYQKDLYLIELKVAAFQKKFIQQVLDYKKDLHLYQQQGKLVAGNIQPFLLLPKITESNRKIAEGEGIICEEFNPEKVLNYFYSEKLRPITSFVDIKPIDIGIWNIHLIHKFIYKIIFTNSINELQKEVDGSNKTLYNKIRFANELGLINWVPNNDHISLSRLGHEYVEAKDEYFENTLSDQQAKLLKEYVMENPYSSSVVLGIASMVESIFALSKNTYPVPLNYLEEYFTYYSGKIYDWQTQKAKRHGAKMYSNYAIDLGLIAKTDASVFLTPEGFKFVVQMQLHKSLKLIKNLVVN